MRELKGWQGWFVGIWCVATSLFHLYTVAVGVFAPLVQRSIHLSFLLPLAFILFPAKKNFSKDKITLMDAVLACLSLVSTLYILINADRLSTRMEYIYPVSNLEVVLGLLNIFLIVEAIRRAVAPVMAAMIPLFLIYFYFGNHISGTFHCNPISLPRLIETQYLLVDPGIYGPILGISATFIAIFVIFAAFLLMGGAGEFFTNIASRVAGGSPGGPAKIAVIGSALFGTISGASSANVYATGSFTIPLMKKMGYSKDFAGAVEAAASTGGMIMPPVMGATAFVIAELTRTPYLIICKSAALGAILYYLAIFFMVHLEACKLGLRSLDVRELPSWKIIMQDIHLIIPIICLLYFLIKGYSAFTAAFFAIIAAFGVSFFRRKTMMTPKKIFVALNVGAKNMIIIALACAGAGIVISVITSSGLGLTISSIAFSLSKGVLFWGVFIIMIASIFLGMGLPTTAAYIVAIAVGGPALQRMGCEALVAHLFVFYFAILSELTPPVAINAYAAASISGGNPIKTGFTAMGLALAGFIVPYIFVYNQALLWRGSILEIFVCFFLTAIALAFFGIAIVGFYKRKINGILRIFSIVVAMFLIYSIILLPLNINILVSAIGCLSILILNVKGKIRKEENIT